MHNFHELEIWKCSRVLVKEIYQASRKFPKEEVFSLCNQIQRAAVSVPSNIAEGCGRGPNANMHYYLGIAIGSSCEVETQLLLAHDLNYIDKDLTDRLTQELTEVRIMMIKFQNRFTKDRQE